MTDPVTAADLPKRIWILWLQGFDAAPHIVQECLLSWRRQNPGWDIVQLDETNLPRWVDLPAALQPGRPDLTPQAIADIVRIHLLAPHGGVWADATCFCCRPLDEWLPGCMGGGFFAFEYPGRDRLLSSWFIASVPNCHLTLKYRDAVTAYWRSNRFLTYRNGWRRRAVLVLERVLNRNPRSTRFWFSAPVTRLLRVHPYFWFHYLLARIVATDDGCRRIWEGRFRYSARGPHMVLREMYLPISDRLQSAIDRREHPVYKLSWRSQPADCSEVRAIDYLLNAGASRQGSDPGGHHPGQTGTGGTRQVHT